MRASIFFVVVSVLLGNASVAAASLPHGTSPAPAVAVDDAFAHTIGDHETEFAFDAAHAGRAHNVELAASLLDGAVIEPGATFSFNDRVGERSIARGFAVAPELHDGHLHEGIGGGVCQVATTLHVAALESGLEIVEHRTHSVPSHYAAPGLDATVFYGRIDFRVRNPHAFPVRVRASAHEGVLTVRLEAREDVPRATVTAETIRTLEASEQTISDASLAPGARVVEERGRDGMVVRVTVTHADGTRTVSTARYSAAARVVRIGA